MLLKHLFLLGLALFQGTNGSKSSRYFQKATPEGQDPICGYESCPKLNPEAEFHVHIVPHSHDDVGWLKTVDQYFFGSKNWVQRAGVQYIIDSVIKELALDPKKRYIQVETAFFWRWWIEQNDDTKQMVKQMVNEGRLEFIGGGWAMHDEATVHYSSLIDNMSFGMKKLHDWFGNCSSPRIGWQIDPFGHSRENARLFNWMGFDGLFFARNDYRDKGQREENKTLDMIWNAGETVVGSDAQLYTEVQIHHYEAPPGFCFDIGCQDDPIMDNPNLHDYNKDEKIQDFLNFCVEDFAKFKEGPGNKHLIYAFGSDFQYQNANQNFKNMDKLIKYVNEKTSETGIEALYSTPSCYMKALYEEYQTNYPDFQWSTKDDDFFPYASGENSYWTGFFTSRPTLKFMERQHNNLLQGAKQIQTLYGNNFQEGKIYANQSDIDILKRAMGTMQHHDAVTGTEKQNVAEDYARSLSEGARAVLSFMGPSLFSKVNVQYPDGFSNFWCPLTNISSCRWTEMEDSNTVMIVYNPLSRPVDKIIRFPVSKANIVVSDGQGQEMDVEFVPIPDTVKNIPGRQSEANYDALFLATNLPPLGYKAFHLERTNDEIAEKILKVQPTVLENLDILASVAFYQGSDEEPQPSGAYIFRPAVHEKTFIGLQEAFEVKGELLEEQWFITANNWTSFIQRKYAHEDHHEIEWLVGPIPDTDDGGTEVVMVFSPPSQVKKQRSDKEEKQVFWTDSNGRQMIRRVQDTRFSYDLQGGEKIQPVASNYYPINSAITTKMDSIDEFWTVLTDRSQGATKINPDEIEIMVHRRLYHDDHLGVGEPLDEHAYGVPLVARGIHHLFRFHQDNALWRRLKSQELYMASIVLFAPTDLDKADWTTLQGVKEYTALKADILPEKIHLMTIENWDSPDQVTEGSFELLLRFEHLLEASEGGESISLEIPEDIFVGLKIEEMVELSLGGDRNVDDVINRFQWSKFQEKHPFKTLSTRTNRRGFKSFGLEMDPMAIRTFKATMTQNATP